MNLWLSNKIQRQHSRPLILVPGREFPRLARQKIEDHARLAHALAVDLENGRLAELVDLASVALAPRLALEEIDENRFPGSAGERQHEGHLVAIAGLGKTVKPIHGFSLVRMEPDAEEAETACYERKAVPIFAAIRLKEVAR